MSFEGNIEYRCLSDPANLCKVRHWVEGVCAKAGVSGREALELVMAVDEAVCNVMRHGYRGRKDGQIVISLRIIDEDGLAVLEVTIRDQSGVRPEQVRARPYDPTTPGGLGIGIIQHTVDFAEYRRAPDGKGLELTIRKRIRSADPRTFRT
ncbi:MAG: ATP-binding protein [Phycisphaeraceae bacterium]|nr:ATP-binding protein [Phycisphaeraceae bacterium]